MFVRHTYILFLTLKIDEVQQCTISAILNQNGSNYNNAVLFEIHVKCLPFTNAIYFLNHFFLQYEDYKKPHKINDFPLILFSCLAGSRET
jgi:hypothetical protein